MKMKLILLLSIVAVAFATESVYKNDSPATLSEYRMHCVPDYVKCRETSQTEKERDDCIWKFIHCIKEDCDTHVCDGYGKLCLKKATTHAGKHVCALGWFRCVQKMHKEICHQPDFDEIMQDSSMEFNGQMECIPNYIKCRGASKTEKERDDCIWKLVYCIKKDCDTHVCDVTAKKCLDIAPTHAAKQICALYWFRCVKEKHKEICHNPEANDVPAISNKHHKHRSTTTQSSHSMKPTRTPKPCGCFCRYTRCNGHARTQKEKDACIKSYATCVKRICDTTKKCDPKARKCLKKAKTHTAKHKCAVDWFKCVKKYQKKICHKRKPYDNSHHKHKHHSSTTQKPSLKPTRTPAKCGCFCRYTRCNGHARTQKEKDACIKSYATCVKRICDTTKKCDPKAKKCLKKAKTHAAKHKCAVDWFKCVKKYQKKICHKRKPYDNSHHKHKHHSSTTQKPSLKPSRTPAKCGCYCQYTRCNGHARTQKEKDACIKRYATCVKRICDTTKKCDPKARKCLKKTKTHTAKHKCAVDWFKCVKKYQKKICHKRKPYDNSHHKHKHHSSTTQKPSLKPTRTPAHCGCYCRYNMCHRHARSHKEEDACLKSYSTCIKRICDTRKCDAKAQKCLKKAKTHTAQHKCGLGWFSCVKKNQKKICH